MCILAVSPQDSLFLGTMRYLAVMLTAELPGPQNSALKLLLHMLPDRERGGMLLVCTAAMSCHAMPAHVMS